MNAVSALLLAILVQLGGVELDTTRDASLQWYRNSQLTGQWELEVTRSGVYRFVSDEGLVVVERLREAPLAYSVLHYDTVSRSPAGNTTGPVPRRLRSLGTVALQPQAQNLRASRPSRGEITVQVSEVPVAWTERVSSQPSNTEEAQDVSDAPDVPTEAEPLNTPQPTAEGEPNGTIAVTVTPGQWSAQHSGTNQVMVLHVR